MKLKVSRIVASLILVTGAFLISGCTALQETMASQMEVPTVEKQANRVAIGMTIVRENNIMAKKMKISADAQWPKEVTAELTDAEKAFVKKALLDDPYFATVNYTEPIQRNKLGSGYLMNQLGGYGQIAATLLNQTISPLTYKAFYKIKIFYGPDKTNWPDVFGFSEDRKNFEEFPETNKYGKKIKLIEPEALSGDVYENITEAFMALIPTNMQKDVEAARDEMMEAYGVVVDLKGGLAEIENKLKRDEARRNAKEQNVKKVPEGIEQEYTPLTDEEIQELNEQKSVLEEKISGAEEIADEKEKIYFELIDQAAVALQSDINLDDTEYVKLAQNVNLVANEIQSSSTEAYTMFGVAAAQLAANGAIQNFGKELETLAIAKASIPLNLQDKYEERLKRLVENVLYILPNMMMGTYYAHKQSALAEKYADYTAIIVEAYETKLEQEAEANAPSEEEVKEVEKEIEPVEQQ